MRIAVYFTPDSGHPLASAAAAWLDRDQVGWATVTAAPRRYGFHATLKAPFRIAEPCTLAHVAGALGRFCRNRQAAEIGRLELKTIGNFIALVPAAPPPALGELAGAAVRYFDRFRAPPTAAETARREPERLSDRERLYLEIWGYPYVFGAFRFHMTLTGPLAGDQIEPLMSALQRHFAEALAEPIAVDAVSLLVEAEPGADFILHQREKLRTALRPSVVA